MLKRLLQINKNLSEKLFDKGASTPTQNAKVIGESDHGINRADVSRNAISVIEQLQQAGHSAYLVGGGVRDLLLGSKPKDFDVATSATPEQVSEIFRRSRIVGKRFRIVHVRFGREIIEVTTFRANHTQSEGEGDAKQSEHGILLRDNVYGDLKSDAERRDFTINALYYDPTTRELLEFSSGLEDLQKRTLRIIGDPEARYKEDPVRLLRAVRFAAKLGFSIEAATEHPIREHADYLSHIPSARLFEEVLKLFLSGSATATLTNLRDYHLFQYLFPSTDYCMENGSDFDREIVFSATVNTDKRIRQGKRVTPAFIYAAFLWPALQASMRHLMHDKKLSALEALGQASQGIISQQLSYTAIPKRFLVPMREIWDLQLRLPKREGKRAFASLEHPRFRAAYDFILLREQAGENIEGLGDWWTKFQTADEETRQSMITDLGRGQPRQKRRRSRRGRRGGQNASANTGNAGNSPTDSGNSGGEGSSPSS
ncbi:polynucleotide adenylyltransferase PcnB [Teredinibacter waterburyi]|jgi:poly(A) polymerase|uniref:polynucleotide adenylyltransferase PcnB n=1 Tax=Teredinibacter waterburyi TaxID=1500538 RepID=UPI00165FCF29|nr:polynucleotide adenylyltransferase PcnB [Teredinibacter waterburyi]